MPKAVPMEPLLCVVGEEGVLMRADLRSELEGQPYQVEHVITILARDRPMYVMMSPEAIPLLKPYMGAADFEGTMRRTQRLRTMWEE